jgi:hypothetical protein
MDIKLYRVLVPTAKGDGHFSTRHHREWDRRVAKISGGVSILTPISGKWKSPSGELIQERIIPVDIACTKEQLLAILKMTKAFYNQQAVMAYCISNEVILL